MARLTQSVGVPSTAKTFGPIVSMRSGRRKRECVSDRARFLNGGNDGDVAEWSQCISQSLDSFRMHSIVIGHQNARHWESILARAKWKV